MNEGHRVIVWNHLFTASDGKKWGQEERYKKGEKEGKR